MYENSTHIRITKEARMALKVWAAKHEVTFTEAILMLVKADNERNEEKE